MTSAWVNSGNAVILVPVFAMSTANKLCFLKWLACQITTRSQMNCHTFHHDFFSSTTLIWSVCLSRTSIFVFIPLFFKASMRRLAAMAAPPIRSDVLMISTLMCIKVYANVRFLEDILDISSKLSAISWEKISKLKRFSANFRALAPIFWASSGWSAMR